MVSKHQVSTRRIINAERQAIFDVIVDPAMHPVIDGSGTVQQVLSGGPDRLSLDATFGADMQMKAARYKVMNRVVEFEEGSSIAWRHFHGHRWRYELRTVAGGTEVTETFDWTHAKSRLALRLAGFPKRNLKAMQGTLERLDELVTTGGVDRRR